MVGYVLRRGVHAVITLLAVITASFFLLRVAPGGPFDLEREMAPEARAALEREWLLDRPLVEQYVDYLGGLLSLPPDMKRPMTQPEYTVTERIAEHLPVSASLGATVLLLAMLVGIPAGLLAARHHNRFADALIMLGATAGIALPSFVIGPMFKRVFALELGWFPVAGWTGPACIALPAMTLAVVYMATVSRLVRSGALEVLSQDWIRTARAKGLSERTILFKHALPGVLAPVVSWLGPATAAVMTGSVVVEKIFAVPGLGRYFVDAALNRDYTFVMGTVVTYSVILIGMNLLADLALAALDPRVRLTGSGGDGR